MQNVQVFNNQSTSTLNNTVPCICLAVSILFSNPSTAEFLKVFRALSADNFNRESVRLVRSLDHRRVAPSKVRPLRLKSLGRCIDAPRDADIVLGIGGES